MVTITVNEDDERETYYHQVFDPTNLEELLAYDVNDDGIDELFMSSGYSVSWIEADGMGHFPVPDGLQSVKNFDLMKFKDMDGDGDEDIISLKQNENGTHNLIWLENNCEFKAFANEESSFEDSNSIDESILIYPSITQDVVNINAENINVVSVYNSVGQLVIQQKNTNKVDVSNLFSGRYIVTITFFDGEFKSEHFIKL